ncbi:MAG: sigma-54 dependent transcriptional regulator [Candidatus Margulisiibacteriota bacterium]
MTPRRKNILVIDDEKGVRESIKMTLKDKYRILEAADGKSALAKMLKEPVDLVLLDVNLPDTNGIKLLKEIKRIDETVNVIMITADNCVKTAVHAMKLGAYDYINKPFNIEELLLLTEKAIEKTSLIKENIYLKASSVSNEMQIVGNSPKTRELLSLIETVAQSPSTVLISGETGVGKELAARQIHKLSARANRLFVTVNCSAIPENLIESELFGHEKGAFTGAFERYIGKFEMADGGTLFLDEVGTLPQAMQAKLLRVLQDKYVERLGGEKPIRVDSRIISATNIDLKKAVKEGKFREDLFYRLNVIPVVVPPLRERRDDIELLTKYFLKKYSAAFGKTMEGFSPEAMSILKDYKWPGNIRELENLVERLVVLSKSPLIDEEDLPKEISRNETAISGPEMEYKSLKEATIAFEKSMIEKIISKAGGNKAKAAKMLGIHRNTLTQIEKKSGEK